MWQIIKKIREKNRGYEGIIRTRVIPFETEQDFAYWWLPERDGAGYVLRQPRIGEREKERYTVCEHTNKIMISGKNAILTYMSSGTNAVPPYNAFFSVGSGVVLGITPQDNQVVGEFFRKQPTGFVLSGNQSDVSIYFGATDAQNTTWTNAGYYGYYGATSTLGSGVLTTHTLYSYYKGGYPITNDYLVIQS